MYHGKIELKALQNFIELEIEFRKRKTISIQLISPLKIKVLSPPYVSREYIEEKVKSRSKWILKKIRQLNDYENLNAEKKFKENSRLKYLGINYDVDFIIDKSAKRVRIMFDGNAFRIIAPVFDYEIIKKHIVRWYRKEAAKIISVRIENYGKMFNRKPALVKVKEQKRRWGTCNLKGNIYFNWRLIMAPPVIIDYLIVHELSHLVHHNHSLYFWNLVESIMPDYKIQKRWLRENEILLNF